MSSKSLEGEVASYVLAYLLKNNFKASATAFLQECNVLPSKSFLVLPETPLHAVIAEHKTRHDAKVLVDTLGSGSAWQELWSKLNTTLQQIKCLGEDLNSRVQPALKSKVQKSIDGADKTSAAGVITTISSPRKRKQGSCRRIQQTSPCSSSSNIQDEPNSPTVQQVLDTFMDETFPGKLASIINQCVSSSDVSQDELSTEVSSETIDRILNATLSEPMLDGALLPSPSCTHLTASQVTPPSLRPHPLLDSSVVQASPSKQACHDHTVKQGIGDYHDEDGTGDYQDYNIEDNSPNLTVKRPRLVNNCTNSTESFPSEQDIESFLDQIHQ